MFWLNLGMAVNALVGVGWVIAYLMYPMALSKIIALLKEGEQRTLTLAISSHAKSARRFILWCGVGHAVMSIQMLLMIHWHLTGDLRPVMFAIWAGVAPFVFGAGVSLYAAGRLSVSTRHIMRMVRDSG